MSDDPVINLQEADPLTYNYMKKIEMVSNPFNYIVLYQLNIVIFYWTNFNKICYGSMISI